MTELTTDLLADLYVLDSLKGFGPQKFKALKEASLQPGDILRSPNLLPIGGKTGDQIRAQLRNVPGSTYEECRTRSSRQLEAAEKNHARILTYNHPDYPPNLFESNHPVPI